MGAPKRTTKSWGLREHLADSSSPYSISLPSFDAESVEVALTSEELAEEHWLCPARDHHISAPLVLPGRAGNGDFRKLPPSFVSPPVFSSGQHWVPPTSCHRGRVSPADGVRPAEDRVSQQHRLSSDCEFGTFCSQSLFLSLPLSSLHLFIIQALYFFPSTSQLLSPLFSPFFSLFNHHSRFFTFSQSLQHLAKKEEGTKVRGRTFNAVTVLTGGGPGDQFLGIASPWPESHGLKEVHLLLVKTTAEHPLAC